MEHKSLLGWLQAFNQKSRTYSPPYVNRMWGIWGSYYNIPTAIFYLLKGDYMLKRCAHDLSSFTQEHFMLSAHKFKSLES